MIFMAVLAVILFFGGWHSPFEGIAYLEAGVSWVPGIIWLLAKSTFFISRDFHAATQFTKAKIFN
jgi:NADH-quinone oxidoreductase subunit H